MDNDFGVEVKCQESSPEPDSDVEVLNVKAAGVGKSLDRSMVVISDSDSETDASVHTPPQSSGSFVNEIPNSYSPEALYREPAWNGQELSITKKSVQSISRHNGVQGRKEEIDAIETEYDSLSEFETAGDDMSFVDGDLQHDGGVGLESESSRTDSPVRSSSSSKTIRPIKKRYDPDEVSDCGDISNSILSLWRVES